MDLSFNPEENAFREEVRRFVAEKLPDAIRHKVMNGVHLNREEHVLWQRTLHARGWGGVGRPQEFGGPGWTPAEQYIFEEECAAAGAPRLISFGLDDRAGADGFRQPGPAAALPAEILMNTRFMRKRIRANDGFIRLNNNTCLIADQF